MAERRQGAQRDERTDDLVRMGWSLARARAWLAAQDGQDESSAADPDPDADGGVCAADADAPLAIWPDNADVLGVWMRLQSQWRLGPRGDMDLQGLRYEAAHLVIERTFRHLAQARRDEVFTQLIEMEHAALEAAHG